MPKKCHLLKLLIINTFIPFFVWLKCTFQTTCIILKSQPPSTISKFSRSSASLIYFSANHESGIVAQDANARFLPQKRCTFADSIRNFKVWIHYFVPLQPIRGRTVAVHFKLGLLLLCFMYFPPGAAHYSTNRIFFSDFNFRTKT